MARGILVFGSSGSGTTTLGRAVAQRLGFLHLDLDDYTWRWDTEVPFTELRSREERIRMMTHDISQSEHFVMSGSMSSIHELFDPLFDLGVHNTAPAQLRVERAHNRELRRFGDRILPGGDMYEDHLRFLDCVSRYDTDASPNLAEHEAWARSLPCPVLRTDGVRPIPENVERIVRAYEQARAERAGA